MQIRTGPQPTYATPTESFAYKVVNPAKFARSISGTMREITPPPRRPTPPAPPVDWATATQELSKLLIPTEGERTTRSCTAEDLGGVRAKKDRLSAVPPTTAAEDSAVGKPRQLRDRAAKARVPVSATPYAESTHSDELESLRSVSSSRISNRRQTMHELPGTGEPEPPRAGMAQRRVSRRLSLGSTLSEKDGVVEEDSRPPVPALPSRLSATQMVQVRVPVAGSVAEGVQIKKTRAPATTSVSRKLTQAPVVDANAPVVGKGSDASNSTSEDGAPIASDATPQSSNAPLGDSNEMEALTSGLKRVSLKVGTREEHDRKQKEREAAERRARALKGAETRRVNAAARKAALLEEQNKGQASQEMAAPALESHLLPGTEAFGTVEADDGPVGDPIVDFGATFGADRGLPQTLRSEAGFGQMPFRADSSMNPVHDADAPFPATEVTIPGSAIPTSVPLRGSGPNETNNFTTHDGSAIQQASNDHLPVQSGDQDVLESVTNVDTPPPPPAPSDTLDGRSLRRQPIVHNNDDVTNGLANSRDTHDFSPSSTIHSSIASETFPNISSLKAPRLPVWNSTGPIPFATAAAVPSERPTSPNSQGTRNSVPNLPRRPARRNHQRLASGISDGNGVSRSMLAVEAGDDPKEVETVSDTTADSTSQKQQDRDSIWDVPETPRP